MLSRVRRARTHVVGPLGANRRRAGLTVIEVLATAVILAVGLVGVGSMVTYGVGSHNKSVDYTIAAARATQELERVREAGYLSAQMGPALFPSPEYTILNATQASFAVPELHVGGGLVTLDEDTEAKAINPSTGLPYANLKVVQVQITWGDGRQRHGSYQAATLVANRP